MLLDLSQLDTAPLLTSVAAKKINLDIGHWRVGGSMYRNDISFVWTREGWLYLAVILVLHSRRVIG